MFRVHIVILVKIENKTWIKNHTSGIGEVFTTTSYEKFVIDNEILSMLKFLL